MCSERRLSGKKVRGARGGEGLIRRLGRGGEVNMRGGRTEFAAEVESRRFLTLRPILEVRRLGGEIPHLGYSATMGDKGT